MAGNRRGKLKEHLEGVHRNYDWVIDHVGKSLDLIGEDNPGLSVALAELGKATVQLDELAQDLYTKI